LPVDTTNEETSTMKLFTFEEKAIETRILSTLTTTKTTPSTIIAIFEETTETMIPSFHAITLSTTAITTYSSVPTTPLISNPFEETTTTDEGFDGITKSKTTLGKTKNNCGNQNDACG
jgi:hypothetical protein